LTIHAGRAPHVEGLVDEVPHDPTGAGEVRLVLLRERCGDATDAHLLQLLDRLVAELERHVMAAEHRLVRERADGGLAATLVDDTEILAERLLLTHVAGDARRTVLEEVVLVGELPAVQRGVEFLRHGA
jgi:hypothetical protein